MKKKILAIICVITLLIGVMPATAWAEDPEPTSIETAIYVSEEGNDTAGNGTMEQPYASLAKAAEVVNADQNNTNYIIYVLSDLTSDACARFYNHNVTIKGMGDTVPVVTRGNGFATQSDTARSWYNPAMIEIQTSSGASLRLENIIFDDHGTYEGTIFAQAVSGENKTDNTQYVQDAIIASNATAPCTITLGEGAVLQNFGGMSAVRVTDRAKLVMERGSKIIDTTVTSRIKGASGSSGPAGAVWIQGASFTMDEGAEINNVIGRAVYADGGTVSLGGQISNITANINMWQGTNGIALHLRNDAVGTLTESCVIDNSDIMASAESAICTFGCDFSAAYGSVIKNINNTKGVAVQGECTVYFDGEITGMTGNANALNLQNAEFQVTVGKNAYIHDNHTGYGTIYIQAQNGKLDIYGRINNNIASDRGGAIAMANNFQYPTIVTMYDGAEICNNYSAQTGGGIMVSVGTFTMKGGIISGNSAGMMGGGVYVRRGGSFVMEDGTISDNTTAAIGGGIAYAAQDYNGGIANVELIGGNISGNKQGATVTVDNETDAVAVNGGESNDLAISSENYGHSTRYLRIADDVTIDNPAVYFVTNTKTVTPREDSLNIKLGNANTESIKTLTAGAVQKGWSSTPLATFWTQRDGLATLSVGGLKLAQDFQGITLPVYVLTQKTGEAGEPVPDAEIKAYAASVNSDGDVSFTLPGDDVSGNGCAVAIVQTTTDYGSVTITGPEKIAEDKDAETYEVRYTATYTMSENLKNIITGSMDSITNEKCYLKFVVQLDSRLTAKTGEEDYNFTSPIFKVEHVTGSGSTLTVDCVLKEDWENHIEELLTNPMTLTGVGVLQSEDFNVGDILETTGNIQVLITTQQGQLPIFIPANTCLTEMVGLCTVTFNHNDGSNTVSEVSVAKGGTAGSTMPVKPTRSGYSFVGWNTKADGSGIVFTSTTVVNSDMTVYAQWSKNSSSGSSGSSKPSKPTELNTEDHYSYIIGDNEGMLHPEGAITRGEVATIFFRLLTDEARETYWSQANDYSDCSSDLWCNNAISTLTNMEILEGCGDGTFRPHAQITRAEFAKIAVSFFDYMVDEYRGYFPDVDENAWYAAYVEAAKEMGLIEGTPGGTFQPNRSITRAEACVIVNRALDRKPDISHLLNEDEMITWPDNDPNAWYYADMQEATNSHDYTWLTVDSETEAMEQWVKKLPQRDWAALEHAWSEANDAPGGEVVK